MTEQTNIPDKFKTKTGEPNIEAILKSYSELEKKLSSLPIAPRDASEYDAPGFGEDDDKVRARFVEIGLTKKQADEVCRLADDLLTPAVQDLYDKQTEAAELSALEKFFGSRDAMHGALAEIEAFGAKYLPAEAFESLCSSHQGIESLYKMMQSAEPKIAAEKNSASDLSESDLRRLMKDPKYWRDHDAEFVRTIDTGFKKLFSE
ncbi:MAG: hypothetical protein LBB23_02325 [Rickettsiales bacterium]|jgi:hypothetical protein|nr:hypothetical protein [Rickettsiales bacterium]